jgi:hypothetical protein
MNTKEYIKKSLDTSNGFITLTSSAAQAVNPSIWDYKLRDYAEANLVVTPLAEQFDFRGAGSDYKVFIDEAPSAAAALVETTNITISAFATRSTVFTPTEYGAAYQVTRKEAVRAFFPVAERMTKKLGYSLALKKDALGVTCLQGKAGTTIFPNAVTAATDIASTDGLNYAVLTKAARVIETALYVPKRVITNYYGKQQILNIATVNKANEFGTRDAVQKGMFGELFGLTFYVTTQIPVANSRSSSVVLGETQSGEQAFGYAIKRDPIMETEYHALGRYWDIVAHEEYDFQMLHAQAVCLITHYAA